MSDSDHETGFVPFDEWYMNRHPDHCPTCLGEGKLEGILPITKLRHVVNCSDCNGSGRRAEGGK